MDAVVTATGFDEDNLLLALMAKNKGIEDVIAKVSRGIYTNMVSQMGVDMALNPLDITVSQILRVIQGKKRIVSSRLIQGQAEIIEIVVTEQMRHIVNKAIKSLKLPNDVLIGPIHRGSDLIIPDGDFVLRADDRVLMISMLTEVPALERMMRTGGKIDFLR